jgi:sugar phosphate isomerase/epimerase
LKKEIERCGRNKNIFAFHICDWKTPTTDLLLDRGLMGEGCINIKQIRDGWKKRASKAIMKWKYFQRDIG